jgi:hypothetical protein
MRRLAALLALAAAHARTVTLYNDRVRLDVAGNTVDAHDGCIVAFLGQYFLYGEFYGNLTGGSFANGGWEDRPRTYIHTTLQTFAPSSQAMWGPGREAGWRWLDVPTSRNGMLTHPDVLAACFASLG